MRIDRKRNLSAVLSVLLCIIILIGMIPATAASTGGGIEALSDLDRFDLGVPTAEDNHTLSASALLDRLFSEDGLVLSDAERAYLDENLYTLTYNTTIPSDAVQTQFEKTTGILTVRIPVYSYTSSGGATAAWIPIEAKVGDVTKTLSLNGEVYTCQFDGLEGMENDFDMEVSFAQTVRFDETVIETLLLKSGTDGAAAKALLDAYEAKYDAYVTALAAYKAWTEYPAKRAARLEYENALAQYLVKKAEYDAYIEAVDTYDERQAAYEDYLKKKAKYDADWAVYEQYKKELAQYEAEYNAYTAYRDLTAQAKAQLTVLETLFVTDSHGWQLYASVLGPTVSQVLSREEELSVLGKDKQVTDAGDATEALRTLLEGYADLRKATYASEHEKYKTLHDYYRTNYTAIKNNFRKLYESLYNLYSEGVVSDYIEGEGKGEHFRQFLGQLYITTCCLDDAEAIKLSWTPTTKWTQTLTELVEDCQMLYDTVKADPSGVIYPTAVVTAPTPIKEVTPPVAPTVVYEPEIPVAVEEPVEPTFVPDPGEEPPRAENPGDAPTEPALSDALVAWAEAYSDVDYAAREALVEARSLTLTATMTRSVSVDNLLRVRFYTHDGELIGEAQAFVDGDGVLGIVLPEDPERAPTAQYAYEFIGWKRFDGTDLIEETLTTDISLRATYERYLCQYQITWKIDGKIDKTEMWDYGTTPVYEVPNKVVGYYDYIFSGWSPTITPVTKNMTYVGYYQKVWRRHTVTWVLDNGARIETETLGEGTTPSYSGIKDFVKNNAWYRFQRWDKTIAPITGDVTYTAIYREAELFSADATGLSNVGVSVSDGTVTVEPTEPVLDFDKLEAFASGNGYDLLLRRGDVSILLDADALKVLKNASCTQIGFDESTDTMQNGTGYTLTFLDANGKTLDVDASLTVQYRYRSVSNASPAYYEKTKDGWSVAESTRQSGVLSATRIGGGTFWVGTEFHILYDSSEFCNTLALPSKAVAGTWVELGTVSCVYGYEITSVLLTLADGTETEIDGDGFLMPDGTVSVALTVERIVYHVSFVVDGKVITEGDYFLGEEISVPETPTLDKGDGMVYSFTGWSPNVTLAGGEEREIVYTAEFLSSRPITDDEQKAMEGNDILVRIILVIVILVAVVASIICAVVFVKKRKKS